MQRGKKKNSLGKGQEFLSIRAGDIKFHVTFLGRLPDQPDEVRSPNSNTSHMTSSNCNLFTCKSNHRCHLSQNKNLLFHF